MNEKDYRPNDVTAVECFHQKKISELNPSLRSMVSLLFPQAGLEDELQSGLCFRYEKPDIYIEWNGERQRVSLKSGQTTNLHIEKINHLILFLRGLGISEKTQKTLLLFHYGDGTLSGNGGKRFDAPYLVKRFAAEIKEANAELNQKAIVRRCILRFVFDGSELRSEKAGFLAYGDPNGFDIVSKDEFIEFVLHQDFATIRNPHIGPFLWIPWSRNLKREDFCEWKRDFVMIRYPNLHRDILAMVQRREKRLAREKLDASGSVDPK